MLVANYFDAFNVLADRVYGMDNALLLDCFIGDLHPKLKREVKSRCPVSLMQAVSLVRLFEEKFCPHTQRWHTTPPAPIASTHKMHFHPTIKNLNHTPPPQSSVINPSLLPTPSKPKFMRKLSPTEIQFRREKNISLSNLLMKSLITQKIHMILLTRLLNQQSTFRAQNHYTSLIMLY